VLPVRMNEAWQRGCASPEAQAPLGERNTRRVFARRVRTRSSPTIGKAVRAAFVLQGSHPRPSTVSVLVCPVTLLQVNVSPEAPAGPEPRYPVATNTLVVTHRLGLIKPGSICRSLFDRLFVVLIRRPPMVGAAHRFDIDAIEQHG
jgi:hypothetical protein